MGAYRMTKNASLNESYYFIILNSSWNVRFIRDLVHLIILILFISILAFIYRQYQYSPISIRPFSHISRSIIAIGMIGLVFNDFLVINGLTHQTWCSLHQISLHFLLAAIVLARLLPTFYEYAEQYDHQYSIHTLKSSIITGFILALLVQLFISIRWLLNHQHVTDLHHHSVVLCFGGVRPQLFILLLHFLDLIFLVQFIRTSTISDDLSSMSSINDILCDLNSILLRLFYFFHSSILQTLFLPGQFSGTIYSGILLIEYLLKSFIPVYYSNLRYERNLDSPNGMIHSGYLRLKNDDLSDDTRLLNDID